MRSLTPLVLFALLVACGSSSVAAPDAGADAGADATERGVLPEKRCGASPSAYISYYKASDLEKYRGCTVIVGRIQEDSVRELQDFSPLSGVRKIEGALNVFRSPGFTSLRGLEHLEVVEGDLSIHLNSNLASIDALQALHTVTGNLYVSGNPNVPHAELEAFAARVTVGGKKDVIQR